MTYADARWGENGRSAKPQLCLPRGYGARDGIPAVNGLLSIGDKEMMAPGNRGRKHVF